MGLLHAISELHPTAQVFAVIGATLIVIAIIWGIVKAIDSI